MFTGDNVSQYMSPYQQLVTDRQKEAAVTDFNRLQGARDAKAVQAGAFGGSRQALMDMENQRNLQSNLANITGQGYATAYDKAREQFNTEQGRGIEAQKMANQYGFDVLGGQATAGATQRGIEAEGIAADKAQFDEATKLFGVVQSISPSLKPSARQAICNAEVALFTAMPYFEPV